MSIAFSKIQKLPEYVYDGLHRLSKAGYDTGGGATRYEDFDYDDLGNRVTYVDELETKTYTYTHNAANQVTGISSTTVSYDTVGNLSRVHMLRIYPMAVTIWWHRSVQT